MSEPAIRYQDRLALLGATGCGKSTVARRLFLASREPRLVIDPADSALTDVPGCAHVYGPKEQLRADDLLQRVRAQLEEKRDAGTIRYVPGLPNRGEEYDAVYGWAFARRFPGYVWADEAGLVLPSAGAPPMATAYLVQGRKRELGHLACHARPVEISRNVIAQAQHVLLWRLPQPADRRTVAELIGLDHIELTRLLGELEPVPGTTATGFLWFQQRAGTVTICPPTKEAA